MPRPNNNTSRMPSNSDTSNKRESNADWQPGTLEELEAFTQSNLNNADKAIEETSDRISSNAGKALGADLKTKLVLETRKKTALEGIKVLKQFVEQDAPTLLKGMEEKYAAKYSLKPSSINPTSYLEGNSINFNNTEVITERNITEESSIESLLNF
jgi:hypothetical protein